MLQDRSPLTRRQTFAVGIGLAIGSSVLPQRWFKSHPHAVTVERDAWPMEQHDPARTGYAGSETGPTREPAVAWQTELGEEQLTRRKLISSGEQIYVTSHHSLTAVDAIEGERQWQLTRLGTLPWGGEQLSTGVSPVLGNGQLFVGANDLYAVNPANGNAQWEYETTSLDEMLRVGNTMYISYGDVLAAVDASSGLERWKAETRLHPKAYAQGQLVGSIGYDGVFGAVDAASGSVEWTREIKRNDAYRIGPCVTNETVYYGTGPLYALDLTDGSTLWTHSLATAGAELKPVSDGTTVYLAVGETNRVLALDASTGDIRWSRKQEAITTGSAPALTEETLYVGLKHGVVAFDTATGAERFLVRKSEAASIQNSPIVVGDTLYVMLDGTLFALTDE
ncbi:outer membrane protein assembly factor BamB family protein [Halocatena marina]|uniref:PQQ-binding-like beta-propeller repeat protein n=1 Tax=Halocatena marina TaxID=2934937 RepID=A0ABD5YW09_9EURY|nr:PQQ-binding-like beta-propeller repeat protein [Halocatena marina]